MRDESCILILRAYSLLHEYDIYQTPASLLGMFGTGIQSYFSFLRFLVMLNLIIFLLMFVFVMFPIIVAPHASGNITYNQNDGEERLVCSVCER